MDAHPIDATIRAEIQQRFAAIESAHGVRVLYACESGSRGWGFAQLTRLESVLPARAKETDFSALDRLLRDAVVRWDGGT